MNNKIDNQLSVTSIQSTLLKKNPSAKSNIRHPYYPNRLVNQSDLDQLHQDILMVGKIFELSFNPQDIPSILPVLDFSAPDINFKSFRLDYSNSAILTIFDKYADQMVPLLNNPSITISPTYSYIKFESIDFRLPDSLAEVLKSGTQAYLVFQYRAGLLKWIYQSEYDALHQYASLREQYEKVAEKIIQAFDATYYYKLFAASIVQHNELTTALPFKWFSAIKDHASGLRESSSGTGTFANTVRHLVFAENYSMGRFKRNQNEYLCSQPKGVIANHLGVVPDTYKALKLKDGETLTDISKVITCKNCLAKIDTFMQRNQN